MCIGLLVNTEVFNILIFVLFDFLPEITKGFEMSRSVGREK